MVLICTSANGEPSQDVSHASILFLVDAKLVLLQPSDPLDGDLRYDMRVIAHNVEYFDLMRDHPTMSTDYTNSDETDDSTTDNNLKKSLWYFNGQQLHCWMSTDDLMQVALLDEQRGLPEAISIPVDFYPNSVLLERGITMGVESNIVHRQDVHFAAFHISKRVS